jgi:chemotaxis protein MotB
MQSSGIRSDQVTQVRGFSDQHLRKLDDPLDPSNRRISLIVQYFGINGDEEAKPTLPNGDRKPDAKTSPLPTENSSKNGGKKE